MALGTQIAPIGTAAKNLIVALDSNGDLAPGHVLVDVNGAAFGVAGNPLSVTQASGPWSVSWSGQSVAATQSGAWTVSLASGSTVALGAGSAAIGSVGVTGSVAVTGAFYQATQPVSLTALPALPTGANVIGGVVQSGTWTVALTGGNATAVKTDGSATIQPVSVAALPLPAGAATAANQSALHADGGSLVHITNPTATQTVVGPVVASAVSTAVESGHILKAAAGTLYFVNVTVSAAGYIMLFNSTTVPADGSVTPAAAPVYCSQAGTYTIDYGSGGKTFTTGISMAFSSTGPVMKTASATAFFEWSVA